MDFDEIEPLNIDEKYIKTYQRNIFKLQRLLSYPEDNQKLFHSELFLKEDIVNVKSSLSKISDSSCQVILCALVKYLKACNLENKKYVDLMRTYGINLKLKQSEKHQENISNIDLTEVKTYIELLKSHACNKVNLPGVRVLSAILASEDQKLITLNLKITTLCIITNDVTKENHIDLFKNKLRIKNISYSLPTFFIERIRDIVEKYNLLCPDSKGNMYKSPEYGSKKISFAFSNLIGKPYLKLSQLIETWGVRPISQRTLSSSQDNSLQEEFHLDVKNDDDFHLHKDEDEDKSLEFKLKKDVELHSSRDLLQLQLQQDDVKYALENSNSVALDVKIKPIIKFKIKIKFNVKSPVNNKRSNEYEWSFFNKQKADEIHIGRVKNIMMLMFEKNEKFYHSDIDSLKGIEDFKKCMVGIENLNTKVNNCNSMCKFLELTLATHYSDYTILRDTYKLDLSIQNSNRDVLNYTILLPKFLAVQSDQSCSNDLKIMCLLLCEIVNTDTMNTGALRFSDLAKTCLIDDNESNFLDLTNHKWHLREGNTKNKKTRIADVSKEFVSGISKLKLHIDTEPLICKNGKTDKISKEFKKFLNVNFSDVRSSYVTYLDLSCNDIDLINTICVNQGHKLSTALENYRRKIVI